MSEGKSIREHIEYYMQYAEEYYDRFMTYYNGREVCRIALNNAWDDYVKHNKRLAQCSETTKQIYKNMYSNIRNALKKEKREKAADFYLNFVNDPSLKALLKEAGLGVRGKAIRIVDARQAALYLLDNMIPRIEKHMHLTGIKPTKNASIMATTLIDFSEAEIVEDNN